MSSVTINQSARLFVIKTHGHISCLGFDVLFKRLAQYSTKLGKTGPSTDEVGTLKQYRDYCSAEKAYIDSNPTGVLYDPETPEVLRQKLEYYRSNKVKLRLFFGSKEGKDSLEEFDVMGFIGNSTGPLKIPLLVKPGAHGGSALSSASIVRIIVVESKREVYRQEGYHLPDIKIVEPDVEGYAETLLVDNIIHARFKKSGSAQKWIDFMKGTRMRAY